MARLCQELFENAGKKRGGNGKGGAQKILDTLLDMPGQDGWDHDLICLLSFCGSFNTIIQHLPGLKKNHDLSVKGSFGALSLQMTVL
jgi:hypothetical protein